jgi:hypothetical protein
MPGGWTPAASPRSPVEGPFRVLLSVAPRLGGAGSRGAADRVRLIPGLRAPDLLALLVKPDDPPRRNSTSHIAPALMG